MISVSPPPAPPLDHSPSDSPSPIVVSPSVTSQVLARSESDTEQAHVTFTSAAVVPTLPVNTHPMKTCSKSDITKSVQKRSMVAISTLLSNDEPENVTQAMKDKRWQN